MRVDSEFGGLKRLGLTLTTISDIYSVASGGCVKEDVGKKDDRVPR
jgi:hypothetical protein